MTDAIARETRDLERVTLPEKLRGAKSSIPAVFGPRQIADLRAKAAMIVDKTLPSVMEAVEGKRNWTPVQAQLFKILWQSVMPTLSHHTSEVDVRVQKLDSLSREQIEELLARDLVDVTPDEPNSGAS